ncbi:TetR/AcrR family transcriptional regulator [Zafaria sp. J156]|uniref:TetR/AcrR family transcriptional regulator n=1 Tax=Micrococcaceae TaxID=1268 RepID=UPI002E783B63|nr:hypothetical protein [Zafaria sp. J156]MEE1622752.1 hypothetical protein [Zafaria sp. J156]
MRIADAALALVEQTGDLQMVQLAKTLGVAPSSLYSHVDGRAEVIDLARLRMLERMEPQPPVTQWREGVERLLRQLTAGYTRHKRMLPLIFGSTISEERTIALYEPVFAALLEAGFIPEQLRLIAALIDFQAMGLAHGFPEPAMTENIRKNLPAYTASIDHSQYSPESATAFSAQVLIRGLASMLREEHG